MLLYKGMQAMSKRIIFDTHCDTMSVMLDEGTELTDKRYSVNLIDALNKLPYIQCFSAFVDPKYVNNNRAFERAINILDKFEIETEKNVEKIHKITTSKDIEEVIENDLFGAILTIENGSAIAGNLDNIEKLYKRGVRIMSVTWNQDNDLACGAMTNNDKGLTNLGKQYIKELEKNNILVDVSHASKQTFYDIAKIATRPVIATHSNTKKLCNHPRNLTDDQIKTIANMGGIIGICFCGKFLTEKEQSNIDDIINHIEHVAQLVGTDCIGLGSDFDGFNPQELPQGLTGIKDINNIFEKMKNRGFSEEDINKIAGGNFVRLLREYI